MVLIELSAITVFPDKLASARIVMDGEKGTIVAVDRSEEAAPAGGVLLFPGFIDIHVHAREYPQPRGDNPDQLRVWEDRCRKETFATAGHAAINGGVTLFAAMPNDPFPPSNEQAYREKLLVAEKSPCPVIVFGQIAEDSEPWADIPYKLYLDVKGTQGAFWDWRTVDGVLRRFRGCHVFFHAEDPEVLEAAPTKGPRWVTRPPEAETSAVEKVLELASKFGIRAHICHVSTERAVRLIADYNKTASEPVTCEVTPHHLFFSVDGETVIPAPCTSGGELCPPVRLGSNPPIRSEADRRFLVEALRDGLIGVLATDHAPHTLEDKGRGAPGMPHLDTIGGFAGWLMAQYSFTPQRIAEILSTNPARIMASYLDTPHGKIEPGACASFTELDLNGTTEVRGREIMGRGRLQTRCGWSPFEGVRLPAAVSRTIIGAREYSKCQKSCPKCTGKPAF